MTTQTSLFTNAVIDIQLDEQSNTIVMNWITTPTSKEFREALERGLKLAQTNGIKKWIGNVVNLGAIDDTDQMWSNQIWFPQAIAAGINKMAVIVSDDIFNQMSVEEIMNKVESLNFESQYFSTVDEALSWLS